MTWVSLHVFYHDPPDGMLVRCVRPLVGELHAAGDIDRFFFVRYMEGGPHCRLRFSVADGAAARVRDRVIERVAAFLREAPSTAVVPQPVLAAMNDSVRQTESIDAPLSVQNNNSIVVVPYAPETERYGGTARLDAAEWHFAVSSAVALDVLTAAAADPVRAGVLKVCAALQFMLSVPQAFGCTNDQIRRLYEWHHRTLHETYARLSHATCEQSRDGGQAMARWVAQAAGRRPPLYEHGRELCARVVGAAPDESAVDRQRVLSRLLASYVHMFLNRLGLFLDHEARLSWALSQCLPVQ